MVNQRIGPLSTNYFLLLYLKKIVIIDYNYTIFYKKANTLLNL